MSELALPLNINALIAAAEAGMLSEVEMRQLYVTLEALDKYHLTHPLACYEPIRAKRDGGPHQLAFHTSDNSGRGAFGGNQSGKTQCGTFEDAFHFCGEYPDWYPQKMRLAPGNIGRIIVKDFPHSVGEVIEPALMKSIAPRFIKDRKTNNKGFLTKLISRTGSRFDIVTHDMDTMALEGWQGHWAHFDEPPPRDKFVATLRGLVRNAGRWWITCTPLSEPWMFDEIYTNPKYFIINIDMRDNPYLSEAAITEFESRLTEDEKEARLHGRFLHLAGLVHKEFDPGVHVKKRQHIPADWPRWMVMDPHTRRPFAMAWFAVDPLGRTWQYDEWPDGWFHEMSSSSRSLKDYVHIIREKEMGQHIHRRIIDGRAGKVPVVAGERQDTLIDAFSDLGLHFEPSYITTTLGITDPGHLAVNDRLRISPLTNEPGHFILDNCRNAIYSFQHNVWMEGRERPAEFAKDFIDLYRYFFMDNPQWLDINPMHEEPRWVRENEAGGPSGGTFGSETW